MANGEQGAFGGFKSFAQQRQDIIDQLVERRLAGVQAAGRAFTQAPNFAARQAALGSQIGQAVSGALLGATPEEAAEAQLAPQRDRLIAEESALTIGQGTADPKRLQFAIDSAQDQGASPEVIAQLQQRKEVLEQRQFNNAAKIRGLDVAEANLLNNVVGRTEEGVWKRLFPKSTPEQRKELANYGKRYLEGMIAVNQFKARGGSGDPGREAGAFDVGVAVKELGDTQSEVLGSFDARVAGLGRDDLVTLGRAVEDEARFRSEKDQRKSLAAHRSDVVRQVFDEKNGVLRRTSTAGLVDGFDFVKANLPNVFRGVKPSKEQSAPTTSVRGRPSDLRDAGILPQVQAGTSGLDVSTMSDEDLRRLAGQ
jgi:hypothetical protein